ncbi:MAG: site-specific DNA-methyltransferase [Candidatus Helarchaeota archaeon]|nr:site-specific DNA-methyltransferase [Candidatus Helarchaeota archaeon]
MDMEMNTVYYEDCVEGMQNRLDKNSIDLIIADPPFGIDFHKMGNQYNRKADFVVKGYTEISAENYYDFTFGWLKQAQRVLKETGSCYIISGWTNLKDVLNAIDAVNLSVINHIIWKYQFGVFTKRKYVTSHYHILFTVKHPKKYYFNKIDHYPEDVWVIKRPYRPGKEKNSTKLPEALVEKLILYSSQEGDLVLDPFLGNATTAVCCIKTNRNYFGFELNPACQNVIDQEIQDAKLVVKTQKSKELDVKAQKSLSQFLES